VNRVLIAGGLAIVLFAGGFVAGWSWRGDRVGAADARQQAGTAAAAVQQVNDTRATEHAQAEQMANIGAKHEEDRTAAEAVPAAFVADLRAGNLRLRDDLATCHTSRLSEAAAAAGERDARAELRPEVAGSAFGIAAAAEGDVRACQAVIRADRQGATQ